MESRLRSYRSLRRIVFRFSGLAVGFIILLLWGSSMATSYETNNLTSPCFGKPQGKKIEKICSNIFKRAQTNI